MTALYNVKTFSLQMYLLTGWNNHNKPAKQSIKPYTLNAYIYTHNPLQCIFRAGKSVVKRALAKTLLN